MTVLVWMFTNFVVIALVLETGGFNQFVEATDLANLKSNRAAVFLTVILWTVAFMALFRFIGCIYYLITRLVEKLRQVNMPLNRMIFLDIYNYIYIYICILRNCILLL